MKKYPLMGALLLGSAWVAVTHAGAHSTGGPEDLIKFRQSGYTFMAWNMGKIKTQVVDQPAQFNKDQVKAAADVIAAIANSGMGALYAPGTETGKGWEKTRVKPELFQQPDEVKKVAMAFVKEANELARVAATGELEAIRGQFGKVGATCKGCHDKFRTEE
ncbi:MAG: cytochrome c [Magnetococcales bacterium]|nr:cytochrome c [Magnetococcales bacterium]